MDIVTHALLGAASGNAYVPLEPGATPVLKALG
jgi:hypothetical protein